MRKRTLAHLQFPLSPWTLGYWGSLARAARPPDSTGGPTGRERTPPGPSRLWGEGCGVRTGSGGFGALPLTPTSPSRLRWAPYLGPRDRPNRREPGGAAGGSRESPVPAQEPRGRADVCAPQPMRPAGGRGRSWGLGTRSRPGRTLPRSGWVPWRAAGTVLAQGGSSRRPRIARSDRASAAPLGRPPASARGKTREERGRLNAASRTSPGERAPGCVEGGRPGGAPGTARRSLR